MNTKKKLKDPKTLRVFFSSPFGGMEEEREELTRKYFPKLNHACAARGIQFIAVDMRWGITSEAADQAQVINICLREIDRSDVFVGFFGQRYGWHGENDELLQKNFQNAREKYPWLSDYQDRSVTELEFLHGHLNNPGKIPACICFRDKVYDDCVRSKAESAGDKKGILKYSPESEHSSQLMNDLISRVEQTEDQCLAFKKNYSDPHEGAKFMFDGIWEQCLQLLTDNQQPKLSPVEKSRQSHNAFLSSLTSLYIGGQEYIDNFPIKQQSVLIVGNPGSGKSALCANLSKYLEEIKNKHVIKYFVGCAPNTTAPEQILSHILMELEDLNQTKQSEIYGPMATASEEAGNLLETYNSVYLELETASSSGKEVVLIIDGLNKLKQTEKTTKHLHWLPYKDLPKGICLVTSTIDSDTETQKLLVEENEFTRLDVQPLEENFQKEMCIEVLKKSGKELSQDQTKRIVEAEKTSNPLFLKIVLSELAMYGYFRLLDQKIDTLVNSKGVEELLMKVLVRMEEDYNVKEYPGNLVREVMSAIAVSHQGLSESQITNLFHIPSHVWSPFFFAVEPFLLSDGSSLRFAFSELQSAVEETYFTYKSCR